MSHPSSFPRYQSCLQHKLVTLCWLCKNPSYKYISFALVDMDWCLGFFVGPLVASPLHIHSLTGLVILLSVPLHYYYCNWFYTLQIRSAQACNRFSLHVGHLSSKWHIQHYHSYLGPLEVSSNLLQHHQRSSIRKISGSLLSHPGRWGVDEMDSEGTDIYLGHCI